MARFPRRHDWLVDAVGIWLLTASLVSILDAFRDAAVNMGDVRGIVGTAVVYLVVPLIDAIAAQLGPTFSTSKVSEIDSRTPQ